MSTIFVRHGRHTFIRAIVFAAAIAGTAVSAAAQPPQAARGSLPASLTNAEFWRIVESFSEPGGSFSSDNFTSNEMSIGQLATELRARGRTGGAYVGVGPEQNFTYISALRPDVVFIVDIRRQAIMQHLMYKALFELSATRSEFIANLFAKPVQAEAANDTSIVELWNRYLPVSSDSLIYARNLALILDHLVSRKGFALTQSDSGSLRFVYDAFVSIGPGINYSGFGRAGRGGAPPALAGRVAGLTINTFGGANFATLTSIADATGTARSFLATEADYQFLKGLHAKNLIVTVVGDFGGTKALRSVADWLRQHGTVVSAFYTSNVEQYLFAPINKAPAFYMNVESMPLDSMSVFIRPFGTGLSLLSGNSQAVGLASIVAVRGAAAAALYGQAAANASIQIRNPLVPQDSTLGWITGTVTDSTTGFPIDGFTVQVTSSAGCTPACYQGVSTGYDGKFTIPNVAPGAASISGRRIGYAGIQRDSLRVGVGQPTTVDMRAQAQALILTGVVSTGLGTPFTVAGVGQDSRARVALCPIIPFLDAFRSGRVVVYPDATACAK